MQRVTKEEFREAVKNMKHVGHASPMPTHGYPNTVEYYEGNGKAGEWWKEEDGTELFYPGEAKE
jgi:hypothetical protein